MTRVRCGWCGRRLWWRLWVRHERRHHQGYAPFALITKGKKP